MRLNRNNRLSAAVAIPVTAGLAAALLTGCSSPSETGTVVPTVGVIEGQAPNNLGNVLIKTCADVPGNVPGVRDIISFTAEPSKVAGQLALTQLNVVLIPGHKPHTYGPPIVDGGASSPSVPGTYSPTRQQVSNISAVLNTRSFPGTRVSLGSEDSVPANLGADVEACVVEIPVTAFAQTLNGVSVEAGNITPGTLVEIGGTPDAYQANPGNEGLGAPLTMTSEQPTSHVIVDSVRVIGPSFGQA